MDSLRETKTDGSGFQLIATRDEFNDMDDDFGAGYKDCKVCGDTKPLKEFWVEANGVGGRKSTCKACASTRTIKRPAKRGEIPLKTIRNAVSKVTNDRIQQALEAAAYRIIKESM